MNLKISITSGGWKAGDEKPPREGNFKSQFRDCWEVYLNRRRGRDFRKTRAEKKNLLVVLTNVAENFRDFVRHVENRLCGLEDAQEAESN